MRNDVRQAIQDLAQDNDGVFGVLSLMSYNTEKASEALKILKELNLTDDEIWNLYRASGERLDDFVLLFGAYNLGVLNAQSIISTAKLKRRLEWGEIVFELAQVRTGTRW